jgi:hypothetical protein
MQWQIERRMKTRIDLKPVREALLDLIFGAIVALDVA